MLRYRLFSHASPKLLQKAVNEATKTPKLKSFSIYRFVSNQKCPPQTLHFLFLL